MITSESLLTKFLMGTGVVGALYAAVEAAPTEMVAKAVPTPWEAVLLASVTLSTVILRKYTAPEKKLDEHNEAVKNQLTQLLLDVNQKGRDDLKWKLETSTVLGSIMTRQEDQGLRIQGLEEKTAEILRK